MNEYKFSDITVGMKESFERTITEEMEDKFREISGDENPLHKDDDFAMKAGAVNGKSRFEKHVCFGMLTASLYSTMAGMYLPGKNSLIHSLEEISFKKPVYAGDTLKVEGEVVERYDELKLIRIKVTIRKQDNNVVSKAKMKVLVLE